MSFKSYVRYTLECGRCGDELDDLYEDELDAEHTGTEFGWVRTADSDHWCGECADEPEIGKDS